MTRASWFVLVLGLAACGPRSPGAEEPTGGQADGGECQSLEDCDAGLVCQGGLCLPYEGGVGDPCYDELDCEMGLSCKSGECVEAPSGQ